jgi:hypothetical protein
LFRCKVALFLGYNVALLLRDCCVGGCVIVVLQGCVIVLLRSRLRDCCVARLRECCVGGCVIVVLQGCMIVLLRSRLRDCCVARLHDCAMLIVKISAT